MMLYRALIRSRMDYRYKVYGAASRGVLSSVPAITNEAIRIATGSFKSTPVSNLHVFTNEKPQTLGKNISLSSITLRLEAS